MGIPIPIDEAAYIAVHIHTAKMNFQNVEKTVQKAAIIQDMVDIISSDLNIAIEKGSMTYQRLITHLEFAINRYYSDQDFYQLDEEMLKMIKEKHEQAYTCASVAANFARTEYNIDFPESELAYIALHVQRLIYEK